MPPILEREVASDVTRLRRRVAEQVSLALLAHYESVSSDLLRDSLSSLQSPAFEWFVTREYAACTSMVTQRLADAQTELLVLFQDAQRESLGLEEAVAVEGLGSEEALEHLLAAYGKETIVKAVLDVRGGQVTVEVSGTLRSVYGSPRLDLVTLATLEDDLRILELSPGEFATLLHRRAVAYKVQAKSQVRAAAFDCIGSCRIGLRGCFRKARRASCYLPDGGRVRNCREYRRQQRDICSSDALECAQACAR